MPLDGCQAKRIDISGLDGSNVTNVANVFKNSNQIEYLNMSNFDFSNITESDSFIKSSSFASNVIIYVKNNTAKQFFMNKNSSLTDDNFVVVNDDSTEP